MFAAQESRADTSAAGAAASSSPTRANARDDANPARPVDPKAEWNDARAAQKLHYEGRTSEAKQLLEDALARGATDPRARRLLHFLLADVSRVAQDWEPFFREIAWLEAEPQPPAGPDRDSWDGLRCSILLDRAAAYGTLGMLDLFGETLRISESAPCAARIQPTLLQLRCQLDLLAYRHERVVKLVDTESAKLATELAALADPPLNEPSSAVSAPSAGAASATPGPTSAPAPKDAAREQQRAALRGQQLALELRKAIALLELNRMGKGGRDAARALLAELAGASAQMSNTIEQRTLEFARADLAFRDGKLDECEQALARLLASLDETPPGARDAQADERAQVEMFRTKIALSRAVDDEHARQRLDALERAYDRLLDVWKRVPSRKGGIGFLHPTNRRLILSELVRLEQRVHGRAEGTRRGLDAILRAQAQGSIARLLGAAECDSRSAERELVGKRRGILLYLPGADRSHVFAWDAAHLVEHELEPVYAIDAAYRAVGDQLALPEKGALEPAAQRTARARIVRDGAVIARMLVPPPIAELVRGWDSITLVGDEFFDDVCFELLDVEGIGVLGIERTLDHVPSVPVGLQLAHARARASDASGPELVFVGAPRASAKLPASYPKFRALELDAEAALRLCGAFGAERSRVLIGADATSSALRESLGPSVRVLHLMMHGVFDKQRERGQGLLFAPHDDDLGPYWTDDIDSDARGFAPPEIVLLSVCQAMRGDVRHGDDGLSHLAGALLARGARCVITSPDDLDFAAARELGRALVDRLAAGDAASAALRAARKAVSERPEFAHPYFWATMRAFGDGRASIR